jgi:hypothetical protein
MEDSDLGLLLGNGKSISIVLIKKRILKSISIQFLAQKTHTLRNNERE